MLATLRVYDPTAARKLLSLARALRDKRRAIEKASTSLVNLMPNGIGHDAMTAPSRSGDHRILIADDEEDFAEFLRDLLVEQGYQVDVAYNGRAGIELMEHLGAPSVLLLDIHMPNMDGYEVMEEMARRDLKAEVIVITAFPNAIERTRLLRLGARAILSKLLPQDAILQEIARISLP